MTIKAVLFDVDGVLLDSEEALVRMHSDALAHFGFPPASREAIVRTNGHLFVNCVRMLVPGIPDFQAEAYAEWTNPRFTSHYIPAFSNAFPDVADVLPALSDRGVRLGVVTSQNRAQFASTLKRIGFNGFDVVVTADDVRRPKPNPEPLEKALAVLGVVGRQDAVFVGDSEVDVQTGRVSGVQTVLMARPWNAHLDGPRLNGLLDLLEWV
ncbi:HAD family hydrolase [Candidatus Micrarchaeota archaeon]|nr:HAD family hydrolase [Candidatus Micrarchaeota archaeon]